MIISLFRHPGSLGRKRPLSVFVNGTRSGTINSNETKGIQIPDLGAIIQVGLTPADEGLDLPSSEKSRHVTHCIMSSPGCLVGPAKAEQVLECGTNWWVVLDLLNLCCASPFKRYVYFVREKT